MVTVRGPAAAVDVGLLAPPELGAVGPAAVVGAREASVAVTGLPACEDVHAPSTSTAAQTVPAPPSRSSRLRT
jgi:hypothetical protein